MNKIIQTEWDAENAFNVLHDISIGYLQEMFHKYFPKEDVERAIALGNWEPVEYLDKISDEDFIQTKREIYACMPYFCDEQYLDIVEELVIEAIDRLDLNPNYF